MLEIFASPLFVILVVFYTVSKQKAQHVEFKHRLRTDFVLFSDFFFDLELDPKQIEFAESCLNRRHTVAIFSRQTGKTTTIILLIIFILCNQKKVSIQCYAPTEKQALTVIFSRLRDMFESQPLLYNKIAKDGIRKSGSIQMKNGNIFQVQTANRDSNIRGFSPTHIIIDESQDVDDMKYNADIVGSGAAMKGLTATEKRRIRKLPPHMQEDALDKVVVKTKIWECGTPKGRSHFYEISLPGTRANVIYQKWHESSFIDREYVMQKKRELPDRHFRAEFECQFDLTEGFAFERDTILTASEGNTERIFYRNPGAIYICGIDLGRSQDHTVMIVLEIIGPIRKMVFCQRWGLDHSWEEITNDLKRHLVVWYPDMTYVDCTGPTGEQYDYWFGDWEEVEHEGFEITRKSKPPMMRVLQVLLQRGLIEIWDDDALIKELWICPMEIAKGEVQRYKFPPPENGHDDFVQSLALACYAAHEYLGISYEEEEGTNTPKSSQYGHRQVTQTPVRERDPAPAYAGGGVSATNFTHGGMSATEMDGDAVIGMSPTMWDKKDGWTKIAGQLHREL